MFIVESFYNLKKKITKFWCDYFTVEGEYTSLLPDKVYLKKLYKKKFNKDLNLKNPIDYCEKIQWLKIYDRRPEYTMMVDKYAVREYITEKIGEEYLFPLIGCWDSVDDIDFSSLPNQFVLKCNHDNGVIICKDRLNLDIEGTKKILQNHLETDFYKKRREWSYKNVKRKIICEKYMDDGLGEGLADYKFFCFDGEVKALFVATERQIDTKFDFFDTSFNHLPIFNGHPNSTKIINKPENFEKMIEICEILSKGIPHVRVDLYNIKGKIYFGEMTFYHYAGFVPFEPYEWEKKFGDWIVLPKKTRCR